MDNTRELVLDVLLEILEEGSYSHLVIRDVLDKYNYSKTRDKAFVKRMVEGTLERLIQIDYILDQFSKVPVSRMKPLIRNLMRMSVYQLLFMDSIPDGAVCNEAVKLAGKRGFKGLAGFVNGVLRNIARNKDRLPYPDRDKDEIRYFSVRYSMPEWLVEKWILSYGREKTSCMLESLLKERPVTVRFRQEQKNAEKDVWIKELKETGAQVKEHPYLPYAYVLDHAAGIKNLPGYAQGWFTVQDVSSMLVAEVAGIEKTDVTDDFLVVDACAAPGGKSMHIAEKLCGKGKVIARDLSEYKVSMIRDNIRRMGYENIEAQVYDACKMDESLLGRADVVLADVPCSGLGIIGKKRDIKYRITEEGIKELIILQRKILDVVWQYVKPGGVLIYSTCTINPDEND
ncbi:MAG: 16S rRNA (cytosine(967)-C(5))-methyltransferase RsmB, partial [Lachnospiraceae bacterium]|nr:16S rRNA (cytosine(967)-C(5))-methyltransferase RsmB [Lachnospiraceae bacterium]